LPGISFSAQKLWLAGLMLEAEIGREGCKGYNSCHGYLGCIASWRIDGCWRSIAFSIRLQVYCFL